jgi:hypothetical protein
MRYAGYVITGWVITAAVLTLYWARVVVRTRRARRIVDVTEP